MKRAYHLNLLLTFIGFSLGFGFVSAQGVNNIQDSYERGEPFLINTFDAVSYTHLTLPTNREV